MRNAWLPILGLPLIWLTTVVGDGVADSRQEAVQVGTISWYGKGFHGRRTANGERYNMHEMTCASRKLPFGTKIEVTNLDNGQKVILRVNDRGPFIRSRILDVSFRAAKELGFLHRGHIRAELRILPENWEALRQEEEWFAQSGIGENLTNGLNVLAEDALDSCRNGKSKKNSVCRTITISQDSR